MSVKRFLFRHQWLAVGLAALLAAIVAETALRLQPLPQYVTNFFGRQVADINLHRPSADARLLYELKPGAQELFIDRSGRRRQVTINSLGLRDPERKIEKDPNVFRIVILGGSSTYGAIVNDDQTLSAQLERLLNEQAGAGRRFEVWNGGVNAYTPTQMAALAGRLIKLGCDPDVILFHIHLIIARFFLADHLKFHYFRQDPTLWRENLLFPTWFPENLAAALAARSRLALLLAVHYNRMLAPKVRKDRLTDNCRRNHEQALRTFMAAYGQNRRVAALDLPAIARVRRTDAELVAEPVGMPVWRIFLPEQEKEYYDLHAQSHVYAAWARALAQQLAAQGWLDELLSSADR